MITLALDTSFYYLVIALIKDDEIIDSVFLSCHKQQSEITVQKIAELLEKNDIKSTEIESIVVTRGPGSYTGVRIAMSIAKIYANQLQIPLFTLSTLQLYAGLDDLVVIIDARGQRGYFGIYSNGKAKIVDQVLEISVIKNILEDYQNYEIYGDGELIGSNQNFRNISKNFLLLKDKWERVDNIHCLAPNYLKDNKQYGN